MCRFNQTSILSGLENNKHLSVYEIVATSSLALRAAPSTQSPVIDRFNSGTLVLRLDDVTYVDQVPDTGVTFYRVRISSNPQLEGYMGVADDGDSFLAQTISAQLAANVLKQECHNRCKCSSC
jgi:hypothetical protein